MIINPNQAAKPWKMWLARIFGKRHVTSDKNVNCVSYFWRGNVYVWKFYETYTLSEVAESQIAHQSKMADLVSEENSLLTELKKQPARAVISKAEGKL